MTLRKQRGIIQAPKNVRKKSEVAEVLAVVVPWYESYDLPKVFLPSKSSTVISFTLALLHPLQSLPKKETYNHSPPCMYSFQDKIRTDDDE
jgi:hypothetical protein